MSTRLSGLPIDYWIISGLPSQDYEWDSSKFISRFFGLQTGLLNNY